ncbi:MAG: hypothetical protein P9L94_14520 [Candidatus Hinthialibacter antarcticus]|nr:hypothetical protein [Candidatus Hinthialibacter antarcticus]
MNKRLILSSVSFLALFFVQSNAIAEVASILELSQSVQKEFQSVQNIQLTFQVLEFYDVNMPDSIIEDYKDEIQQYQKFLQDRKNKTLSSEEEQNWACVTDEDLEEMIAERQEAIKKQPVDAIYVFSSDGTKIRQDVYRPNEPNGTEHFYLYDGLNGTMTTVDDNVVRTGDFLTRRWTDFGCFARFGSGMETVFAPSAHYEKRLINKDGVQKLFVESPTLQSRDRHVEFTLLDENPNYWTKCEHIQNGKVILQFVCEDFEDHGGLLVPKVVHSQKLFEDGFRDELVFTLIDVKNGDVEFSDDFFTPSATESPIVRRMNR